MASRRGCGRDNYQWKPARSHPNSPGPNISNMRGSRCPWLSNALVLNTAIRQEDGSCNCSHPGNCGCWLSNAGSIRVGNRTRLATETPLGTEYPVVLGYRTWETDWFCLVSCNRLVLSLPTASSSYWH